MDIVDVILAKALTPQGAVEQYAAQARQAAADANAAVSAAEDAVNAAELATQAVEEALEQLDTSVPQEVKTEVAKLLLEMATEHTNTAELVNLLLKYDDQTLSTLNSVVKYYSATGQNTDGTMTQKAITDALKELDDKIDQGGGGSGGGSNLGPENSGKIVVVGSDGTIISGDITEEELMQALIQSGAYDAKDAVGLEIDYANKTFTRIQEAQGKTEGYDFDSYSMYGGRRRCNVADNGMITAFYGEAEFMDDGSNGQVMIYQPKFYYMRLPMTTEEKFDGGKVIRKEQILISSTAQAGFKLHPLFITPNGEELDYVLISAYEGSAYINSTNTYDTTDSSMIDFSADKLSSVNNAKPISGVNKDFTVVNAEQMAQNRGGGWHITNLAAESALQMLELVEFGTLNMQGALELGIVNIPNNADYNCASITGSTRVLGNETGNANETINEINGSYNYYTNDGRRAISYRGMENPWGNIWRMIGGLNIVGNGYANGGMPYICTDFNYTPSFVGNNYEAVGFYLPAVFDWISGFGYNDSKYDWVFIPTECSGANSALPVGDNLWTLANLNSINMGMIGGVWSFGDSCGPFYYACDKAPSEAARAYSARLMYIPEKDEIYLANIAKWEEEMGV